MKSIPKIGVTRKEFFIRNYNFGMDGLGGSIIIFDAKLPAKSTLKNTHAGAFF
jgi:hypothetical protein